MIKEEDYGRDHWTVLVYAETRCVDYRGNLDRKHLRTDGDKYPTRLKEGELPGHSDLSCLEDLDDMGYVDFRRGALIVIMTDKGWNKVAALRRERGCIRRVNDDNT